MEASQGRPTIAVFDSGVGGMTILASLTKKIPGASFVYFGDTANAPYGPRSADDIFSLSVVAIERLRAYKPDVIVIACNTVTSTSIAKLREKFPNIQFVGVEPAIKPAVIVTEKKKVLVAATTATLQSESYQALKKTWATGVKVLDVPKPEWVRMVEENQIDDTILATDAAEILASGADTLVLACTHFPFLKKKLQECLPDMMIIDSAEPVANRVARILDVPGGDTIMAQPLIEWIFSCEDDLTKRQRDHLWKTLLTEQRPRVVP